MMKVGAAVLAAGAGLRYVASGGTNHKLLESWRGRAVVRWALEHALEADLARTWVVTGAVELNDVIPAGIEVLVNPRWAEGQATSLQVAIDAARLAGLDAVVIGLGDQPMIPPATWRLIANAKGSIAVATYDGQRRNPVRLGREVWELLPAVGDEGARSVMRNHPDLVTEIPCDGEPTDIDTVEDLTRWD